MKSERPINICVVGLGFGAEFIPIYQALPEVGNVAICARTPASVQEVGDNFGIPENLRFTDFNRVIESEDIDAVHILTPFKVHAEQTLAALRAGKHCACTVPMATSVEDCIEIVKTRKETGLVYMMMETTLYSREYLYVKDLVTSGQLGRVQFVRGSHQQDMGLEGWPDYWLGMPPMHYGTHAIAPLVDITGSLIERVACHGSGRIDESLISNYGSPFAIETATFTLAGSDVKAEATRSLYNTVRQYRESFDCYGEKLSFEWEQIENEGHLLHEGGESCRRVGVPDTDSLLPEPIKKFTRRELIDNKEHASFIQGAGHGGSHPHMVWQFVSSILNGTPAPEDAVKSANITAAGLLAHQSAMDSGNPIDMPKFEEM